MEFLLVNLFKKFLKSYDALLNIKLLGSTVKSEATSAAEHKGKVIMHDPFAMRPFFSYNFGDYIKHWLSMNQPNRKLPKLV